MHSDPSVSVLILNWNGRGVLTRCLVSLEKQTCRDFEVIVVDNGSQDGSADGLEQRWPGIQVIRLDNNVGFAAANNLAAKRAKGEWLALLNNDAFPTPEWMEMLLKAAQKYPGYTMLASKILQERNPGRLDGCGDVYHVSGLVWNRWHNHPAGSAGGTPQEVFSPQGAAALISKNAFLEVGGFDESYFSYHEDIDLAFRLRLQGHRCLYIPQAQVFHEGSHSTGRGSDFAVEYGHRNMVWCYFQNMPAALFWLYLPQHLLANLLISVYIVSKGQVAAILRAKWAALRGLPGILRKRRQVQSNIKISPAELRTSMARGLLAPYIHGITSRRMARKHIPGAESTSS